MFLGVSVMTLPTVAADGDFGGEDDEWSSSSDKSRKKAKKKAKRSKKSKKEVEDANFGPSDEDKAREKAEKVRENNIAIVDRQLWGKMKTIKVEQVNFKKTKVSEVLRFMKEEAAKNGLELAATYLPANVGHIVSGAGGATKSLPEPTVSAIRLSGASLTDLLEMSCTQLRCQYIVENNEVKILNPLHYFSRTYSIAKDDLYAGRTESEIGDDEEELMDELRSRGLRILRDTKISFENGDKQLVYFAPLSAHVSMAEVERKITELRAGLPKTAALFKRYCSTIRKIGKACEKMQGGSAKKMKSKFAKLMKQLEAACPESKTEQMEFYIRVNSHEQKKLNKLVGEAEGALQSLIDECYDSEEEEAAAAGENLYALMQQFVHE